MAHFRDPTFAPDKAIPERVYAPIANAQLEHHPFKDGSASLNDIMLVLHEIRKLPQAPFDICVRAVLDTVMAVSHDGCNCYGRGLVYLRHITVGRDVTIESVARELLRSATHVCPPPDNVEPRSAPRYEKDFKSRLEALGIPPVEAYESIGCDKKNVRHDLQKTDQFRWI